VPYGPSYLAEPSGTFVRYDAMAIGAGSEGAQTSLRAEYHSVREAESRAAVCAVVSGDEHY
jgi:20S proteasome subunit alpha 5